MPRPWLREFDRRKSNFKEMSNVIAVGILPIVERKFATERAEEESPKPAFVLQIFGVRSRRQLNSGPSGGRLVFSTPPPTSDSSKVSKNCFWLKVGRLNLNKE